MGNLSVQDIVKLASIACSFSTKRWDSVVLKALQTSIKQLLANVLYLSRCEYSSLCFVLVQKANYTGSGYSMLSDLVHYGMLAGGLVVFIVFPID